MYLFKVDAKIIGMRNDDFKFIIVSFVHVWAKVHTRKYVNILPRM